MDADRITASASTAPEAPEERGAGGKLRKPPPRKPPASPYARPPPTSQRRWISKLVDPAYRLIAGGANRFLPSFFSTAASDSALDDGPTSATQDQGQWRTGEHGNKDDLLKSDLHHLAFESSTKDISGKLNRGFDLVLPRKDEKEEQSENNRLSDIEQFVKGRKFTRDEIDHLVEVLNSREIVVSNVEQGNRHTNLTSQQDDEGLVMTHRLPKVSSERRHEESNGAIWGSSTPLGLSKVQDEIGASPIEIARAYMGSRASEAGPSSKNMIQTVESTVLHGDEAAIKPYDPSPSKKSSTCWPGAMASGAYATPQTAQSQGRRYGLHNLPRTPYSRTPLTNSKSKLIHMQGNFSHISSTPLRQYQHVQDKSEVGASESGYGSVGPIRRTRHKVGVQSTSRRPAYSSLNPSQRESSGVIEGLTPTVSMSMAPYETSSTRKPLGFEGGVPTVHRHTSLMAKKILEHIDRNVPTPKEKSAELKLATQWKNPDSVNISTTLSNEDNGLVKLKDVSPCKYDGLDEKKSTLTNEDKGNCNVDIQPRDSTDKSIDITKGILASEMNVFSSIPRLGNDARTTQNFGTSQMFSMKSTAKDALMTLPSGGQYHSVVSQEKKTLANYAASKQPALPPISIKKPESRWAFASDNGSGFTFPVTASSSVFSEPPTPSIMPLFSTGNNEHQLKERPTELSYSFGLKKSNPALVFSFPSTSNTAVHNDAGGAIKFNFGSADKARLSFSFGNNGICC